MMPKMSGFQVLHRLQRHPVMRRIPVFVVSALEQQQILSLPGVSHVFAKGQFRLQELMAAVQGIMETPKAG
jgi:CheY-like chemotaxis protein